MSIIHRLRRPAQLCATVCALLMLATSGAAFAAPDPLAPERYYSSFGTADSSAALAQEQYYSSYGDTQPLNRAQSPIPSNDTPWMPIALSIAGALAIVALSATQFRRVRLRRRRTAHTSA